jgi:hypothetical protein
MKTSVFAIFTVMAVGACTAPAGLEEPPTSDKAQVARKENQKEIKRVIKKITSWSVWRGPCDGFSWRDLKLFSGKEKACRELQRLFDELYALGRDSPETVLRELCTTNGGIELSYAAHWFVSCDSQEFAPVISRMLARPKDFVTADDFGPGFGVTEGSRLASQAVREFLLYMLEGSAGVLAPSEELQLTLYALRDGREYRKRALAECDRVAAIDVLVNELDKDTVSGLDALQYATFGFHLDEWEVEQWRSWWESKKNLTFEEIVAENMEDFFNGGFKRSPGTDPYIMGRWVMLMHVFPLGPVHVEDQQGRPVVFDRLNSAKASADIILSRMRELWDVLRVRSPEQRALIGLNNAFRILGLGDATDAERATALYIIKSSFQAKNLRGIGILPFYGDNKPIPAASKVAELVAWWETKPTIVWDQASRLFHEQ